MEDDIPEVHPVLGTKEVRNFNEIDWDGLKFSQQESWAEICQEHYNMIIKLGYVPSQSTIAPARNNLSLASIREDSKTSKKSKKSKHSRSMSKHASVAKHSSKQKASFAEDESSADAPRVHLKPLKSGKKKRTKAKVTIVNDSLESSEEPAESRR